MGLLGNCVGGVYQLLTRQLDDTVRRASTHAFGFDAQLTALHEAIPP